MQEQRKNIVVTGGNSGIGLETARGLYGDGHHIIIGSRNEDRNYEAIKDITASFPQSTGSITSCKLDLSKRSSVESFAKFVKGQFRQLDILINNAGLILSESSMSELGIQMTMTINHFGPFYLTYLLFPLMRQVSQGRIINVSSMGHFFSSVNPADDLAVEQGFSSMGQYSKSKLANVMFTAALAERLKTADINNIKTMSLHPGAVDSNFGADSCLIRFFSRCCCCVYVDNETGARTSLFLSRVNFAELRSGEYYNDDTRWKEMNKMGRKKAELDKLWAVSQKTYSIQFLG